MQKKDEERGGKVADVIETDRSDPSEFSTYAIGQLLLNVL